MDKRIEEIDKYYTYGERKIKFVGESVRLISALGEVEENIGEYEAHSKAKERLLEVIANVSIVLDQIVCFFDGEEITTKKRNEELDRQIKRIEEERNKDTLVPVVYGIHGIHANKKYQEYCWRLNGVVEPEKGRILRVHTNKGIDNIYVTRTGELPYSEAKDLRTVAGYVEVSVNE